MKILSQRISSFECTLAGKIHVLILPTTTCILNFFYQNITLLSIVKQSSYSHAIQEFPVTACTGHYFKQLAPKTVHCKLQSYTSIL